MTRGTISAQAKFAFVLGLFLLSFLGHQAAAQLSGTLTIPGTYATVQAAIFDLNFQGVGPGGVTFDIAAGHSEVFSTPTAGRITDTSMNMANPVVFQKSGAGPNPIITAGIGTSTTVDGIIVIAGGDYITFDGITVKDTSANTTTTTQMEWGFAALKAAATNGSQHIVIKNCSVSLFKTNTATKCIYLGNHTATSTTALTIAQTWGTNSDCEIYGNSVGNALAGIYLNGYSSASPYTYFDQNNQVGVLAGNTITNYGTTTTCYGIYAIYQNNIVISNNSVHSGSGGTSTMYGIFTSTAINSNVEVSFNTVTLLSSATTSTIYGINNAMGGTGTNNLIRINNNTVQNCTYAGATSGVWYLLYNTATCRDIEMTGNTVTGNSKPGTGAAYLIYQSASIVNNANISGNFVTNNTNTGTGAMYCLYNSPTTTSTTLLFGNTVKGNSNTSTGIVYSLYSNAGKFNEIYQNTLDSNSSAGGAVYGVYISGGTRTAVYKNRIRKLSSTTTASAVHGIYLNSGTYNIVTNNHITELTAPASTGAPAITGIYAHGATSSYDSIAYNSVYLDASSSGAAFSTAALYSTTSPAKIELRNNAFINMSTPGSTGRTVAHWRATVDVADFTDTTNNNCYYAGTPGASNLIYFDGTNADQTLGQMKGRFSPKESNSVTELPPFLMVTSAPYDLHLNAATATRLESGGIRFASPSVPDDFDNDSRHGEAGYVGLGTAPDIGADEGEYTLLGCTGTPAGGTATVLPGTVCTGLSAMIAAFGASEDPGVIYQWQESDDNGVINPWTNVSSGSGATTLSYTTPGYAGTIWYRCKVTCTTSSLFAYSVAAEMKAGLSGVYTINSAVSTGGSNFQSFSDAAARLNTYGMCGPVTLNVVVGSGPYTEQFALSPIGRANLTDSLSINGNFETLEATPTAGNFAVVDLNNSHDVKLNNLTIKGLSPTYGIGIAIRDSSKRIRVQNCTIDLSAVTSATAASSAYIAFTKFNNVSNSGGSNGDSCQIIGNMLKGGSGGGAYYGIYLGGTGAPTNSNEFNLIADNTIEDFYTYGVYSTYNYANIFRGNLIQRPNRSSVSTFYGFYLINGSRADVVEKNRIRNPFGAALTSTSTAYGIGFATPNVPAGLETKVFNNVIENMNGLGIQYGIYGTSIHNVLVYHNTVSLDDSTSGTTANSTYGIYCTATTSPGASFRNNIVTVRRPSSTNKYCVYLSGVNLSSCNYNDLYIGGIGINAIGYQNALTGITLVDWQAVNSNAYDQNSVSVDPLYEDPSAGLLKPQVSGVNDIGQNLLAIVVDDITGAGRTATPDPGAWEFAPSSMSITVTTSHPLSGSVPVGSPDQLILRFRVVTSGVLLPLTLTDFKLSTAGSTSAADLDSAKLYYSGSTATPPVFSPATQWGNGIALPNGSFTITGSQVLTPGTHYYWLTYRIAPGATACNVIDAASDSVIAGSVFTPSPTAPAGNRIIKAPLSGVYTISHLAVPSCASYTSIADAVYEVTNIGVGGPVTFNVAAGHVENSSNNLLSTTTASSTNTIVFQKSGVGANPLITATTGTGTLDGVIKIAGTDYVTFDGIDIQESSGNTVATPQMEWGYAILKASASDGSNNITIKNSNITLSRYTSCWGIYQDNHTPLSTSALTITGISGRSSYNTFRNNTIRGTYNGIRVYGASDTTYYDHGTDLGESGGNIVTNYAGGGSTAYGIYTGYQDDMRLANNQVNTVFNHTTTLYGIYLTTGTNSNLDMYNNVVSLSDSGTTGTMAGIYNSGMGTSGTSNTVNVYNNTVTGCTYPRATSGPFYGLYSSCSAFILNLHGNEVSNNTLGAVTATATGAMYLLYPTGTATGAGSVHNIYNNQIRGNSRIQSAAGAGANYILYCLGGGVTTNVYGNEVVNNSLSSTGITYGMYFSAAAASRNVYQNRVDTLTALDGSVYGMYFTGATTVNVFRNRVSNISATGATALLYGMYISDGTTVNLWNNMIADLKTPAATSTPGLFGLYINTPTTARVYYNSIALAASSAGATFGSTGLYATVTPALDLRNNIVVNTSTPVGVNGRTVAYQRSGSSNATYADSSNGNCFHAGTPSSSRLLFYNGVESIETIVQYRSLVGPNRDKWSISENPPFLSTTTPYDLHLNTATATACESGASRVTTVAAGMDFDSDIRHGETGYAGSGGSPDIGADEGGFTFVDVLPPSIVYAPLGNASATSTRPFNNVVITDFSGVNGTSGTRPRVYYKKGFLYNELNDNTSATQGWKYVEAAGTTSPFAFIIDHSILPGGSVAGGDTVYYFVTAQDAWSTPNVGIASGAFATAPTSVALSSAAFPVTSAGMYTIANLTLAGTVFVGSAQTYTSLTGVGGIFDIINSNVLSGDLDIQITSDLTETGFVPLREFSETGTGGYSILIRSNGSPWIVSGAYADSTMIKFDAAKRVKVDGGAAKNLTFKNIGASAATAGPVFHFRFGASSDTLTNLNIHCNSSSTTRGAVTFSGLGSNSDIVISNSVISDPEMVLVPTLAHGLYSGSAGNGGLKVLNNNIINWSTVGVQFTGVGNTCIVSGNSFYKTGAAASTQMRAISVLAGAGHTVSYNSIGGSDAWRGGGAMTTTSSSTPALIGIALTPTSASTTMANGNIMGNVYCSSGGFYGFYILGGAVSMTGNRIGSLTATSDTIRSGSTTYLHYNSGGTMVSCTNDTVGYVSTTGTVYPFYLASGDQSVTDCRVNHVSGSSTMYGAYLSSTGGMNSVTGNVFTDITSIGTMYPIYTAGTGPTHYIANNTVQDITNNSTTSAFYGIYTTGTGTNTVQGNTVQRFTYNGTTTPSMVGIYVTPTGLWNTITNNTVDSLVNGATQGGVRGIYVTSSSGSTISGNTVSRLWSKNNLDVINKGIVYGMQISNGADTVVNNTVNGLHTSYDTTATNFGVMGLGLSAANANQILSRNLVYDVNNHNTGTLSTVTTGFYFANSAGPATVSRNRCYRITAIGTGVAAAAPTINALYVGGTANATFSNNMAAVGEGVGGDAIIASFVDETSGATNWFYNTSYVSGTSGGSNSSAAFAKEATNTSSLRNNIFFNARSGGTGSHLALSNANGATGWAASTSDFNLLVSSNASTIGRWSTTDYGFGGWQGISGGDTYSLTATTAGLAASDLFVDETTGDLNIDNSNAACWYVHGKGIAGSVSGSIADDYASTNVRGITLGFGSDIGADEFTTSTTPPAAVASGAPSNSGFTTYSFGGQTLAAINWGAGGTVPSSIDFRYYSGDTPPGSLVGNYSDAYVSITATGGSGFAYDITFGYSPAWLGTVTTEANIRLAKRDAGVWDYLSTSVVNTITKTISQVGLTSFSEFAITDATSPLPVELVAFRARLQDNTVRLDWRTASELNAFRYYVERRTPLGWEEIGYVNARGSVDTPSDYTFTDDRLPKASEIVYRLRMVDRDGSTEFSNEVRVATGTPDGFRVFANYPNPFNPGTTISFAIPAEEHVTVKVHDASGREIESLQDGIMPSGTHSVTFFSRDLPSGVYMYTVRAGTSVKTGTMILTR